MCHSFGFYKPVTPLVFTSDGKYIGGLEHFKEHVVFTQLRRLYRVESDLKKPDRSKRAQLDLETCEEGMKKTADGPSLLDRIHKRLEEIREEGQIQIIDGDFEHVVQSGLEVTSIQFYVKRSQLLAPTNEDLSPLFGKELPFIRIPELTLDQDSAEGIDPDLEIVKDDFRHTSMSKESKDLSKESASVEEESKTEEESPDVSQEAVKESPEGEEAEELEQVHTEAGEMEEEEQDSLLLYKLTDFNLGDFIARFQGLLKKKEPVKSLPVVPVPKAIRTVCIPDSFVVESISDNFVLAAHPFPLIPGQLFIFPGEHTDQENRWLVRDISMTPNWIKVVNIPSQRPVYQDGILTDTIPGAEILMVKGHSGNLLAGRGYTVTGLDMGQLATHNSSLKVNTVKVTINHILTEQDWAVWFPLIRQTQAIGFFQWLPYGAKK